MGENRGGPFGPLLADAVEQRIAELLAAAPPLTDDQRGRLAALLRPPEPSSDAAFE